MKLCPHCGKEILAAAKKCRYCKQWIEEKTLNMVPCPICGEEIEEGTTICPHCQEKIDSDAKIDVVSSQDLPTQIDGASKKQYPWLKYAVACLLAVCLIALIWSIVHSQANSANNQSSELITSSASVSEISSSDIDVDLTGVWKSTNRDFEVEITMEYDKSSGTLRIEDCWIYRLTSWDVSGKVENGEVIITGPSFDATLHYDNGNLIGHVKSTEASAPYDGTVTFTKKDLSTPKAYMEALGSDWVEYISKKTWMEDSDGGKSEATEGIALKFRGSPCMMHFRMWAQDNLEYDGEYTFLNDTDVLIKFNGNEVGARFSTDMSTLTLYISKDEEIVLTKFN